MGVNAEASHQLEFQAMGSTITVLGEHAVGHPYWERSMQTLFAQVEQTASRFLTDSPLSVFNRTPPKQWFEVSPWFQQLLARAWHYAESTDYLFQPFIGSAMIDWGYRESFEQMPSSISPTPITSQYGQSEQPQLQFDDTKRYVLRTTAHQLDLGGIGKGWTAQWAAQTMKDMFHVGTGCVDAGGDIVLWSKQEPWIIGVQDPFQENQEIAQLHIREGAIATSNTLHRRWQVNGQTIHHLFNGRTGMPVQSDIVQATVCGVHADETEVAAKIICMLGSEQADAWMKEHFPHLGFLYVLESSDLRVNRKLFDYVERCS